MFCEKCGSVLEEGSKFCASCGAKVEETTAAPGGQPVQNMPSGQPQGYPNMQQGMPGGQPQGYPNMQQETPGRKNGKIFAILLAAVAVVVVAVIAVVAVGKITKTINLNDYVTITYSGYDGYGEASYTFDGEAFTEDYADKLKWKTKDDDAEELEYYYGELTGELAAEYIYELCVSCTLDPSENLKNGDTVTLTWSCDDEEVEEYFGYKLSYSDITEEVSGLEEAEAFDPFESINVTFSGISPNGEVSIEYVLSGGIYDELYFNADTYYGLSNGDTVTVTLGNSDLEYLAEEYGLVPSETSKEYTVEGLSSYLMSLAELPDSALEQMCAQMEDEITAYYANKADYISLKKTEYIGSYLLVPKTSDGYSTPRLTLVYKITAREHCKEHEFDNKFSYYWCATYDEVQILGDGTAEFDVMDYSTVYESFERTVPEPQWFYDETTIYYEGYETLDDLYSDVVETQISAYSCESSVEDET